MTKTASKLILWLSLILFVLGIGLASLAPQYVADAAQASTQLAHKAPLFFACVFILTFITVITLGLPGGAIFSILSGYFFGAGAGFMVCVLSTLISALFVWVLVRHSEINVPEHLFAQQRLTITQFMQRHAFYAVLIIRIIPVIPFYLASLLLSYTDVRLSVYGWGTALGVIPARWPFPGLARDCTAR